MIKFCSVTTLPAKWRRVVREEMSWSSGGMQYALMHNLPQCKLALNFDGEQLVCWAMLCALNCEGDGRPYIGAWTREGQRKKGYATKTIQALLSHVGIPTTRGINVYSLRTESILEKLGYSSFLHVWDGYGLKSKIEV